MQPLLALLRGRSPQISGDAEWAALLGVAEAENVLPWMAEQFRILNAPCAPEHRLELQQIRRQSQIAAFIWTQTLKSILAAFDRAAIAVISLKGPCLAERLYGDAAFRTCHDLDLLVARRDVCRADAVLAEIGFAPHGGADDYHRRWRRKGIDLELHHNLENPLAFNLDIDGVWARACTAEFQGMPIRLMHPADELLYLCLHAVRHRFEVLSLMVDLSLAFRLTPSIAATEIGSPALDNVVLLARMMAAHLDSQVTVGDFDRVRPRNQRRLRKIADELWNERMHEPARGFDWQAQHRFYIEVENPGWHRLCRRGRHLRILATRLIDDDFQFAGRFHLRRNWQVRILRPVRLLIKSLLPSPKAL